MGTYRKVVSPRERTAGVKEEVKERNKIRGRKRVMNSRLYTLYTHTENKQKSMNYEAGTLFYKATEFEI